MTVCNSDNRYGVAQLIVAPTIAEGANYTTIASALTAASSGQTIFIRPGTYTENLTLKVGVNLTAFGSDSSINATGKVIINGTCTLTAAGSVTISGIQLQTNSAALLAVTGSAASIVNLIDCYLNCSNNTGITFSSSSASAIINVYNTDGNLGTTGIAYFSHSSAGTLNFYKSSYNNTGASTTANTASAGTLFVFYSQFTNPITSSSTASINLFWSIFPMSGNTTALTHGGSGGTHAAVYCYFSSGSASAISISSTLDLYFCSVQSTNTNAITGAGTVNYTNLTFTVGSSVKINTTTQVGGTIQGGVTQAPSAGFLGERIANSASSVATTSAASKTITSITLTAGIWDITGASYAVPTGGTAVMSIGYCSISTTDNTISGTGGIDYTQLNIVGNSTTLSLIPPNVRAVVTANTIYYLVVQNQYTSTTCPTNGSITATRVG